jgi:hypothetical protein
MIARLFIAAAVAAATSATPAGADDFYRGKTLTLVVGYAVGGGYDVYGRLLGRHIADHIPGHPAIVVQNMPGAASLTALRHQELLAPRDGTVATLFDFFQILNSIFYPQKTKFDFRKANWIGSIAEDLSVCYVWGARGIKTLDELRKSGEVHMGLTAAGSMQDIRFRVLKRLLGVDVRPVLGYKGTAAQFIAIERGELDAGCGGWSSLPLNWRTEHKINTLVRLVPTVAANMPAGVPYAGDLVASERDRQVLKLLSNPGQLGKPLVVSGSVPAARVAILRRAFDETMKDSQFLADAARLQVDISPKSAGESADIIREILSMPADVVAEAKKLIAD